MTSSLPVARTPPAAGGGPGTGLRRDIEGLRAVAVLAVLLYHLRVPGLPGGFAGVDVFFVISGFLITGLLLREGLRTGRIDLPTFWARRARRLLPAGLLVVLVTVLAGWWVLPGSQLRHLAHDALGSTFYVVNWVLADRAVDYLAEDAGVSPLQHYWSLSIEEQFYLLWPLLVVLGLWLTARGRTRRLRGTLALLLAPLVLGSLVWSVLLTSADPARAYFVTTTRLWQLGVGALLALAVPLLVRMPRLLAEVLAAAGLAAVLATVVLAGPHTAWPGYAATAPVLGVAAVIAAGCRQGPTLVGRALGWGPLVLLGGLSYALYLWHWPLIVLAEARWGTLPAPALAGVGIVAVVLAWLTKVAVEDPCRYQGWLAASTVRSLLVGLAAMVAVGAVALTLLATRPALDGQHDAPGAAVLVADVDAVPWTPVADPQRVYTRSGPLVPHPDRAPEDVPAYYADGCQVDQGDPDPRWDCRYGEASGAEVVLAGDSKAGQFFTAVEHVAREEGWSLTTYLKSICPFTVDGAAHEDCSAFGRAVVEHVEQQETPPRVLLLSNGAVHTPELEEGMVEAVRRVQALGTTVVVLQDTDYPPGSRYPCAAEHPEDLRACEFPAEDGRGGTVLLEAVARRTGAPVIDLRPWICPDRDLCPVAVGGQLIWRQGSHVTDSYARSLTPMLYRELAGLGLTQADPATITPQDVPTDGTGGRR